MTVHFIGAGPGAADLITVRGLRLIERCTVCLYAGSLVPRAILASAPPGARLIDTAPLTLDEIVAHMRQAHAGGLDIARLHSGDPSLYGAVAEQMRRLAALGIPFDVTPGVPSFAAAAAALGCELTLPEVTQTVILTRTTTRSSPMPESEGLERLATSGATLAIHLSVANLAPVVRALTPSYGADCPAVVAYRVSWPDELLIRGTLGDIRAKVKKARITRTALVLVGRAISDEGAAQRRQGPPPVVLPPDKLTTPHADCGIGILLNVDQSTDRLQVWSGETSWVQPASTRSEFRSGAGDEVRSAQPCDQRRASLDLVRILMRCRCGEEQTLSPPISPASRLAATRA